MRKALITIFLAASITLSLGGCESGKTPDNLENTENTEIAVTENTENSDVEVIENEAGDFVLINSDNIIGEMKVGWNLGNSMDGYNGSMASESAWNVSVKKEVIDAVAKAGFGTVRIPVSYIGRVSEGPDYIIDTVWLDRVEEITNWVLDAGMYAIINIHHDGNNTSAAWLSIETENQSEVRAKFQKMWEQISDRFKDYNEKLVFESMNEIMEHENYSVNLKENTYENINTLNQIFVDTVRASGGNNDKRWLLVPGYNTNIDATMPEIGFVLPKDSAEKRLMVSVHYYDPYEFSLDEKVKIYRWGENVHARGMTTWGKEDYVNEQMKKLKDTYTSNGIPVIIGEYGAIDKSYIDESNVEYRRYYMEYVANAAVKNGALPVYWDNGYNGNNGFALFDRYNGDEIYPTIIEGIVRGATGGDYEIKVADVIIEE